jgi:precorrin-3B synthase
MRVGDICPGIAHAVPAKDGLLVRIRMPGGIIYPVELAAIATASAACADGQLEVTSRSNLQLRGIGVHALASLVEDLIAAGLLPSFTHDRVRNILLSPLAGLDAGELYDTRPMARLLDQRLLANPEFAELPPKFSIAIDGGGQWFSHETSDLVLSALPSTDSVRWHLSIGGIATPIVTATENAVPCLLAASQACLGARDRYGISPRGRALVAHPAAFHAAVSQLGEFALPMAPPSDFRLVSGIPLGVYPGKHRGLLNIVPSVPLGRISARQAHTIAALAREASLDLRLAPWRGLVLGMVAEDSAPKLVRCLDDLGLPVDGRDGYAGIAACAGLAGCEASLADVRADAAALAGRLAGRGLRPGWRVGLSGCEKQCAMRVPATVKLVAEPTGYRMEIEEKCTDENCSPEDAIAMIASLHTSAYGDHRDA